MFPDEREEPSPCLASIIKESSPSVGPRPVLGRKSYLPVGVIGFSDGLLPLPLGVVIFFEEKKESTTSPKPISLANPCAPTPNAAACLVINFLGLERSLKFPILSIKNLASAFAFCD